jgi:hypothetical protein
MMLVISTPYNRKILIATVLAKESRIQIFFSKGGKGL